VPLAPDDPAVLDPAAPPVVLDPPAPADEPPAPGVPVALVSDESSDPQATKAALARSSAVAESARRCDVEIMKASKGKGVRRRIAALAGGLKRELRHGRG
jgi:hypothetical protein